MKNLLAGIVTLYAWFLAATTVPAGIYSVTDLGALINLGVRSDSRPNAINSNGKVAAANVVGGAYRAFLYRGSWTNLGTLGGNESIAIDVNDTGVVVGYSKLANDTTRGFVWTPGGSDGVPGNPQMKALGTLGGANSEAYSINGSGQISGYAQTSTADHAFRYDNGTLTDIGALLGNKLPNSYGFGINAAGHVTGTAYNNSFSTTAAFFYSGSTAVEIGDLGGGDSSALAINDNDQIVGYSTVTAGLDEAHAFRYAGGVMTNLGTLGGHYSYANDVNNSNVIVGGSFTDVGDTIYHAFICTSNSMTDLNGLLDATGAGWTLIEARAINDGGQIVGTGTRSGISRAFLLNPVPQITQQPTNLSVTCLANASFAFYAMPPPVSYQWYKGSPPAGSPIATATTNILTLTNATTVEAGDYYAVAAGPYASVTSLVATLTVLDSTPPVISGCPADLTNNTAPGTCTAVVTWTDPTAIDGCDGVVPATCTPTNGSTFNKGVTIVTVRANDSSGNTNTCCFTVTVLDQQSPVISGCPDDLIRFVAPGASTAVVTWTNPTASDNCDGSVPVVCTPSSGSVFYKGATSVSCEAEDSSGNINSCSFTVTVVESQPPNITDVKLSGTDVLISFTTLTDAQYSVQSLIPFTTNNWSNLNPAVAGNGSVMTITDSVDPSLIEQFYRVRLSHP